MSIVSPPCGPHCGIRSNAEGTVTREGHCPCGSPCHQGSPPPAPDIAVRELGRPMCERWYERAGEHRPWIRP